MYKFAGSLFWIGVVAGAMTAVHVPLLLLARARIRAMLADEDETKARINRLRRKQGLSEDHGTERRSARRPPDLWDSTLSTLPRIELWLVLLVFQARRARPLGSVGGLGTHRFPTHEPSPNHMPQPPQRDVGRNIDRAATPLASHAAKHLYRAM